MNGNGDLNKKIDPFLAMNIQSRTPTEYKEMERSKIYAYEEIVEESGHDPKVGFTFRFKGDLNEISAQYSGLTIRSKIDNLATAEAPISVVRDLAGFETIEYMEATLPMTKELDLTNPEVRVDQVRQNLGLRGKGSIIGIIDTGIDYTHLDFRNPNGTSRILYLWDQNQKDDSLPPTVLGRRPQPFDYGREYSKDEIDGALQNPDPFLMVPQKDEDGHGTHVAGIATGNGRASQGKYIGMAPDADIVFVKYWSEENLADSNTLIHAVQYIFDKANEMKRSAVINISLGNQLGPHDGTSQFELYVDKLLMEAHGRAIVKSAGNDGNFGLHAEGIVEQNGVSILRFNIAPNDRDDDLISLWYETNDEYEISITSPIRQTTASVKLGNNITHTFTTGNIVEIFHKERDKEQTVNSVLIGIRKGNATEIQEGVWTINITGNKVVKGKFDAWIERLYSRLGSAPSFIGNRVNEETISLPGTSHYILTVGNYKSKCDIAISSSKGPTRDGRLKPDIAAPGMCIMSTSSSQANYYPNPCDGRIDLAGNYVKLSGTSMAAPTVSGIVALMFEKQPTLSAAVIKTIVTTSARRDEFAANTPNNIWGYGKIDASAILNQLPFTEAIPMYLGSGLGIELASSCQFTNNYKNRNLNWLTISGKVTFFASPDSTFQAIKETLSDTRESELIIGIYDFTVKYVADLINDAISRGVVVRLMIDKDSRKGSAETENEVIQYLKNAGASFVWSPSCNNEYISTFTNCHEKTFVISSKANGSNSVIPTKVMICSGNWSDNGIPSNVWKKDLEGNYNSKPEEVFKNGNREWGIILENMELAKLFYDILSDDFNESSSAKEHRFRAPTETILKDEFRSDVFEEDITEDTTATKKLYPPLTLNLDNVEVIPLLSPDNYFEVVSELLDSAKKIIRIQQQNINPNGKYGAVSSIVSTLIKVKAKNPNLDIRFMRSSKFMKNSDYIVLDQLNKADCNIRFHNPKQYVHLHNKGIIIDDEIVVITSTNLTDTSIMENRECGLVIKSKVAADYFVKLFDSDWEFGLEKPYDKPTELVTENDPRIKTGRYRRISLADIIEI